MNEYKHTQIGYILIGIVLILTIYFSFIVMITKEKSILFSFLIVVIILFLFSTLTVIVNDNGVQLKFGVGLIHKEFNRNQIIKCKIIRTKWYYGLGIRMTPTGWLYNVSGLDAVEIEMNNGKLYKIGTDEPEKLKKEIEKRIER